MHINISSLMSVMLSLSDKLHKFFARDFNELQNLQSSHKPLDSFIDRTEAKVDNFIIEELQILRPKFGVASRVSGDIINAEKSSYDDIKRTWIINPLDGRENFMHSMPFFSSSIAVESESPDGNSKITAVMIFFPVLNEVYFSETDKGFWRKELIREDFSKVKVSSKSEISSSLVITDNANSKLLHQVPQSNIRNFACNTMSIAYFASGKADACILDKTNEYDQDIARLIIKEAKGKIVSCNKSSADPHKLIAHNGNITF